MPKKSPPSGTSPKPTAPTGRLVITDLDGIKNGGTQMTHWPPDPSKLGRYSWKCPDCHRWFYWSVDYKGWMLG